MPANQAFGWRVSRLARPALALAGHAAMRPWTRMIGWTRQRRGRRFILSEQVVQAMAEVMPW